MACMGQSSDIPTIRVFFALWPDAAVSEALATGQASLERLCGGRAIRAEMLHMTLVFIGAIDQTRLEALQLAAQEVVAPRFTMRFDTLRYWGHNHIVYATPSQAPRKLQYLVNALQERLAVHRFRFDAREHKPHVTLLRKARCGDEPMPQLAPVRWQVSDFALVQSANERGSLEYRVLARFSLSHSGA